MLTVALDVVVFLAGLAAIITFCRPYIRRALRSHRRRRELEETGESVPKSH